MTRTLLCVLVAIATAGCELDAREPVRGSFERSLTVNGPVELDVRTASGGIRIDTGPADTVRVVARIRASNWFDIDPERRIRDIEANPPIEQNGNIIRIGTSDNERLRNVSIGYEITVPEATRIHSVAGSGGQTIRHVRGPVDATVGSGGIRVEDTVGDLQAIVGSGGIRLSGVRGAVTARAGSGGIKLTIPDDMPFTLDAHAGSGGIRSDQPVATTAPTSRQSLRGTVRGGGARVALDVGSGGIRIE